MKNSQNCLTMLSLIIASSCIAAPVYAADQYGKSDIQESGTASVTEGNLTESGDKGSDNLYGGYAQITGVSGGNATVTDSKADLTNVTTTGYVSGGISLIEHGSGEATTTGSTLTISGGTYHDLYGGNATAQSGTATASSNHIIFDDAIISTGGAVYGGNSRVYGSSSDTSTAIAEKNTLHIVQSSESASLPNLVAGGMAKVDSANEGLLSASANGIEITNGTYGDICGGLVELDGNGSATTSNNGAYTYTEDGKTVEHKGVLKNVTVSRFFGGWARTTAQGTATASENIFTIEQGNVSVVIGGQSTVGQGTATAQGNKITFL